MKRCCNLLCCEVNTNPPNQESMNFQLQLGFEQVGVMTASDT